MLLCVAYDRRLISARVARPTLSDDARRHWQCMNVTHVHSNIMLPGAAPSTGGRVIERGRQATTKMQMCWLEIAAKVMRTARTARICDYVSQNIAGATGVRCNYFNHANARHTLCQHNRARCVLCTNAVVYYRTLSREKFASETVGYRCKNVARVA